MKENVRRIRTPNSSVNIANFVIELVHNGKSNIDQIVRSIKVYLETDRMAGINELYTAVSLKPIAAPKRSL